MKKATTVKEAGCRPAKENDYGDSENYNDNGKCDVPH